MYVIIVTRSEVCVVKHEVESVAILDSIKLFPDETREEGTDLSVRGGLFRNSSRKHVDVEKNPAKMIMLVYFCSIC